MRFKCPFSGIEYTLQGVNAPAFQILPHPLLQTSYRTIYNNRKALPLHLVLIRSLIETGIVSFEHALHADNSLREYEKLQIIDYLHSMQDYISTHACELPHLNISNEMNLAHVQTWQQELANCIIILQHKERNLKDVIHKASLPFNEMLKLIKKNDQGSNRYIQRILQSPRDTLTLMEYCGLENPKEYYLQRNLEPAITQALEKQDTLLYHLLVGLREEQNRLENSLHIPQAQEKQKSLRELLEEKKAKVQSK